MHNFFVQCFDKNGNELTDLRSSSYESAIATGLSAFAQKGWFASPVAAVFVSTVEGFEPIASSSRAADSKDGS